MNKLMRFSLQVVGEAIGLEILTVDSVRNNPVDGFITSFHIYGREIAVGSGKGAGRPSQAGYHDAVDSNCNSYIKLSLSSLTQALSLYRSSKLQNADPPSEVAKSDYAINGVISYPKSEVISADIERTGGLSKTVLVGEKSISSEHYRDGKSAGDTLTMYVGDSDDIRRTVKGPPIADIDEGIGFGSAHPSGCNIAMGDGSVRFALVTNDLQP
jgi:prepilin-type processing-associated H-X9-DG protein